MSSRTRPDRSHPSHPIPHQPARRTSRLVAAPQPAPPAPDPHPFLRRLRRRTMVAAVVGFGTFFGLAAVNVVGVTARNGAAGGTTAGSVGAAPASLPPGDFFGAPGVPISSAAGDQAPMPPPPLINGGGAAMMSSGGS